MQDKGTSVGLDISEDLLRVRLPYLDNELSTVRMLQRSQTMLPSTRRSYVTPRRQQVDLKPKTSSSGGKLTLQTVKQDKVQSTGDKSASTEHLPALPSSTTRVLYDDRNLFLDGMPFMGRSATQTPRDKTKPSDKVATMYNISNTGLEFYGKPNFSQLYRTRSELEIIEQAKQMLAESGFEDDQLLKQDVEKLGKGISSLYLSDFGLHNERLAETSGMSLHKRLLPADNIEEEVQNMALKHIYMSQIPSLITRNSPARRSVASFRNTMRPHGYRKIQRSFDRNDDSRRGRRNMNSPRKLGSEKSYVHEASLSKRTPFHSVENLTDIHTDKMLQTAIDIQGTPVSVHMTSKRIL